MKLGDLVKICPEYSDPDVIGLGIIVDTAEGELYLKTGVVKFLVLFPDGLFPMYSYEIELVNECQEGT